MHRIKKISIVNSGIIFTKKGNCSKIKISCVTRVTHACYPRAKEGESFGHCFNTVIYSVLGGDLMGVLRAVSLYSFAYTLSWHIYNYKLLCQISLCAFRIQPNNQRRRNFQSEAQDNRSSCGEWEYKRWKYFYNVELYATDYNLCSTWTDSIGPAVTQQRGSQQGFNASALALNQTL